MRAFSLAGLELRRFTRGRLPRAAVVALLLVPLLYGALYLKSFWDPYGKLDKLPVALVNQDRAVTADGTKVDAGHDLVESLKESKTFGWQVTSADEAAKGVASGRYYLSLTIPEDFSANIVGSNSDHPERGSLKVETNDSNNYLVGSISRSVLTQVRAAASAKASAGFYDRIFIGFADLHDKTGQAAAGADQLGNGAAQAGQGAAALADGSRNAQDAAGQLARGSAAAEQGAARLADGSSTAGGAAGQLAAGLDQAKQGSGELSAGLARIDDSLAQLSDGAAQVADGTRQLTDRIGPDAAKISPLLHTYPQQIQTAAEAAAKAAHDVSTGLKDLPGRSAKILADARSVSAAVDAAYAERCPAVSADTAQCRLDAQLVALGHRLLASAEQLDAVVQENVPKLDGWAADAATVEQLARQLAQPGLADSFDASVAKIRQLDAGAHQLADGAARLKQGTAQALTGIRTLDSGLGRLDDGAHSLSGGLYQLSSGARTLDAGLGRVADGNGRLADGLGGLTDGARKLDDGLGQLTDGSRELASRLHEGAGQIPAWTEDQRKARTVAMSDPIELAKQELNKAPNYGTGFAPYFVPLALWVGAMVAFMLLRPLSPRGLAANAPAWRVALAGWLPAAAVSLAQAGLLLAVLHWAIGLEMVRTAGVIGYLALTVLAFTALMQWISARFGPAGRLLALALLMLQLTSAGGTYPIETSPLFFRAISPFLPMTYVIAGLRRLISGGDTAIVWQGCAVLAAYWLGSLALTVLTARGKQMWSMSRLHPELSL
ncbi:YhgE/Pip domain-containing protein [Kitasatospora paracochleata]|uniref:Membrane protein n=1 Tax=Kitasatospora paracochleata TaxID=58354 RepID=A0ABT1J7F4_9ACTN|nr:YhgE/Pip domain-containing protein [Kitasatospora paracochleata]MCP2313048.1 putative membrane protein [Kitasatospora paracochleata]